MELCNLASVKNEVQKTLRGKIFRLTMYTATENTRHATL